LGKLFELALIEEIKILKESNITATSGTRDNDILTYIDAIKYLHEAKNNYMKHFSVYFSKLYVLYVLL